jgi:hypothetical protein
LEQLHNELIWDAGGKRWEERRPVRGKAKRERERERYKGTMDEKKDRAEQNKGGSSIWPLTLSAGAGGEEEESGRARKTIR